MSFGLLNHPEPTFAEDDYRGVMLSKGGASHDCSGWMQAVPTALRGAFQSCGQNCAGAERFIVHAAVHDAFVARVTEATKRMRQGPPLGGNPVDAGSMCLPGLADKVSQLVQDAVAHGAAVRQCLLPRLVALGRAAWMAWMDVMYCRGSWRRRLTHDCDGACRYIRACAHGRASEGHAGLTQACMLASHRHAKRART